MTSSLAINLGKCTNGRIRPIVYTLITIQRNFYHVQRRRVLKISSRVDRSPSIGERPTMFGRHSGAWQWSYSIVNPIFLSFWFPISALGLWYSRHHYSSSYSFASLQEYPYSLNFIHSYCSMIRSSACVAADDVSVRCVSTPHKTL